MKKILIITTLLSVLLVGCGKDNYDEPTSVIRGKVTYNGKAIGVRGTAEVIQLQLYQDGYQLKDHIPVYVGQDGSFSAKVFDGQYKLVARSNNGPWVNASQDTVIINLKGNTEVNYEVTPYFTIDNVAIALNADKNISANFTINKVVQSATVRYYSLIVNKTAFVDDAINIWRKEYTDPNLSVSLSEDLSSLNQINTNGPLFARVGVRSNLSEQPIYSEVVKIK
ncbi:DUF3823 domain-containing protein [Sphingobacterium rhinopitheci]|uniref:DUF3823 domain-containing protein n=1 Tax=Sphingobacterium rhinopitheci TaxID=2781960 RepID=UPI001F528171|nr:DUF3823 domain-containing protein [Sphingobacterium rhinopitheci]MCI0920915.1 DUF3823 domain-containing protein [Sphingobacterium rhinopitheci]